MTCRWPLRAIPQLLSAATPQGSEHIEHHRTSFGMRLVRGALDFVNSLDMQFDVYIYIILYIYIHIHR